MWTTVSDSEHDHEREALAWLRRRLPEREPYHVWTNFEFTASNGRLYEVDALAITDNGLHLIEIKGYPGVIEGDGGTWQWTGPGDKFRQFDNPRILANRKAKVLKSLLENSAAFTKHRRDVPYLSECVFLSDPRLTVKLNRHGRDQIFGRDPESQSDGLPPERATIGGVVEYLTTLDPHPDGRPRRRIQRPVVERLVKAINQIGIRERTSRREVGDYLVGPLLEDVTADTTTGIAYQDFLGRHRSLGTERRLRIYPLELNATGEQREAAQRAARREFNLLRPLEHPGIVRPIDYTDHERGPVLLFDYDPNEIGMAEYLASPAAGQLTVSARLTMIRQIAEAVAFAAGRGVHHRALAPSAILVTRRSEGDEPEAAADPDAAPEVRVTNWHAGARVNRDGTSTVVTGTAHSHIEALAADDTDLYRAPEFHQAGARPATLDVFSLGALALHILTGQPPASSARRLRSVLAQTGHLDPASVADGVDPDLAEAVVYATDTDPRRRPPSAEDYLAWLDQVEESWLTDQEEDNAVPVDEARRGHVLHDGRFEVLGRLGQGSTAFALLAKDFTRADRLVVLKVAADESQNDRLIDEAAALEGLDHHSTIAWMEDDEPLVIDDRVVLVLRYAGPRRGAATSETTRDRTLAARLAREPIGVELAQRWGRDLLDAIRYLEQMGRAHRDIKPDNLGIATVGANDELHLVLFDFSLSNAPLDAIEAGTQGYIDPFLVKRRRWDPAADRYSATVVLHELTTGRKPIYGDGSADPGYLESPPPPHLPGDLFDPAVASGLVDFFSTALQPRVEDRFGTADEMERAWHRAFSAADEPSTPSDHPDGDDDFVLPEGVGLSTGLAELPLSKRSVSSLERADVLTIKDLLAYPETQLHSLRGVGAKTRGEIREALAVLRTRFEPDASAGRTATGDVRVDAPAEPAIGHGTAHDASVAAEDGSRAALDGEAASGLRALAAGCVPKATRKGQGSSAALARIYTGLRDDMDPWATQSDLAAALDVTAGRISQLTGSHRKRWAKQPAITELRNRIRDELARLQVASVDQLAARLVAASSDPADTVDSASARAAARGLVRVATLAEESLTEPGWILRRRGGAALLAVQPTVEGTGANDGGTPAATAQALADYAVSLAAVTASLLADEEILSRTQLVAGLVEEPRPAGVEPLPPAHLADLAADLCDEVAVNARLELYRPGLAPLAALRASRRALLAPGKPLTPDDVTVKVRARFPEAAPLPGRPELDQLLIDAGTDLEWHNGADGPDGEANGGSGYLSPAHDLALTSAASSSVSRWGSDVPRPAIPEVEWDNAAEFEARLLDAVERGRSLVLLSEPRNLQAATEQLDRLVSATVSVDAWLVDRLHAITDDGRPSWETVTSADAAGESGPAWGRLQTVVDRALDDFTERLLAVEGTVLLTDAGLLARYDRLTMLATWRDTIETRSHPLRALWLLIPATGASEQPLLGNRAVPVTSRNQWAEIPADWLRGGDRVAKGTP